MLSMSTVSCSRTKWKRQTTASMRAEQLRNHACDEIDCPGARRQTLHQTTPSAEMTAPQSRSSSSSSTAHQQMLEMGGHRSAVSPLNEGGITATSEYCRQCDVLQKLHAAATGGIVVPSLTDQLHQLHHHHRRSSVQTSATVIPSSFHDTASAAEHILTRLQYMSGISHPFRMCCRL